MTPAPTNDQAVELLHDLAAKATSENSRMSYLLEAALRPGLRDFLREHVVRNGGVGPEVLPDIYMCVFGKLAAELVENTMLTVSGTRRDRKRLLAFLKERFAAQLDHAFKGKAHIAGEVRRPNA